MKIRKPKWDLQNYVLNGINVGIVKGYNWQSMNWKGKLYLNDKEEMFNSYKEAAQFVEREYLKYIKRFLIK